MKISRKERKGREENGKPGQAGTRRLFRQTIDDSFDSVFEASCTEINQQSKSMAAQPELGEDLFAVNSRKFFNRLQFDNDFVLDQEVSAKSLVEDQCVISNRDGNLPFNAKVVLAQFMRQNHFINTLKETRSRLCVDRECGVENDFGQPVFVERGLGFLHETKNGVWDGPIQAEFWGIGTDRNSRLSKPLRPWRSLREA